MRFRALQFCKRSVINRNHSSYDEARELRLLERTVTWVDRVIPGI